MTIRFTCSDCASVLKIKDELAGTSGRCPKCKTKFVVPNPSSESESSDGHAVVAAKFENADTHEEPGSNHSRPDRAVPIQNQSASLQSETVERATNAKDPAFDPAETLRLEDSDDELNIGGSLSSFEMTTSDDSPQESETDNSKALASDDDDMDSPPMMVSHPTIHAKLGSSHTMSTKSEGLLLASEKASTTTKPARSASDSATFDPLKFLMDNPAPIAPEPVPSNPNTNRREEYPDYSLSSNNDSDLPDRPSARPLNRPTPAAKASRPPAEKVDLATAAKMMKKAIKDSQAEVAHQQELDAKAGFDFGQIFREFGLKGLGILVGGILLSIGLYYAADRVFSTRLKLPKLGYVTGVVKLDGKPLPGAMVNFAPETVDIAGTKRERIRTSVGMTDDNGQFRMMYIPADNVAGVAAGSCRVWVTHMGPKGRSDVPAEWSEGALVKKEVTPGHQKAPMEINMETKTR